jgi:hypothetical protein
MVSICLINSYSYLVIQGSLYPTKDDTPSSHRLERFIIETSLIHPDLAFKALQLYNSYCEEDPQKFTTITKAASD